MIDLDIPSHVPPDLVVRSFPFAFGATTLENPFHQMVAGVHQGPEIAYVPDFYPGGEGGWVPRRQADMRAIYLDTEHFSNQDTTPFPILTQASWRVLPQESDQPLHGAYRAFLNPLFSPKATARLDTRIRACAREYVAAIKGKGRIDFVREFAFEFPIKIFIELMGLPLTQMKQFLSWAGNLTHAPDTESLIAATNDVVAYLRTVIDDRKRNPTGDLVSSAVAARIDGGRALTDDELLGFCFNLFVGGLDTISTSLSWQFLHLADHPDHRRQLCADPTLIPAAIDEMMRAYSAVTTFRICSREIEFRGVTFKPGDKVALSTTLAAHDPAAFDRPGEVILDRRPRHVSFGYGPHLCLGMHLAKREMRIAHEEFLAAIPDFRRVPDVEIRTALYGIVHPDRVMLEWDI